MPGRNSPDLPASPDFLVLGLGNPGQRYRDTRHNLGFRVVDELAAARRLAWQDAPGPSSATVLSMGARLGVLAKPLTFMNRSGVAARELLAALLGPALPGLLVVTDDLDLPLGRVRLRASGGHGGHNGLRSIIDVLGTRDFPRLRIGIGRPLEEGTDEVVDHVLDRFRPEERPAVDEAVLRARDAVEAFAERGIDAAMNRFNV
jgi:PTH1 family peptidyl-tRNA hydrolase